jgi:hypothetical protein
VVALVCSKHPWGSLIRDSTACKRVEKLLLKSFREKLEEPGSREEGIQIEKFV